MQDTRWFATGIATDPEFADVSGDIQSQGNTNEDDVDEQVFWLYYLIVIVSVLLCCFAYLIFGAYRRKKEEDEVSHSAIILHVQTWKNFILSIRILR